MQLEMLINAAFESMLVSRLQGDTLQSALSHAYQLVKHICMHTVAFCTALLCSADRYLFKAWLDCERGLLPPCWEGGTWLCAHQTQARQANVVVSMHFEQGSGVSRGIPRP